MCSVCVYVCVCVVSSFKYGGTVLSARLCNIPFVKHLPEEGKKS